MDVGSFFTILNPTLLLLGLATLVTIIVLITIASKEKIKKTEKE
jgi:hypothetical protein